jgi:hypothetical protein
MNTILILKPIIDALYEEMRQYQDRTDKRIQWLEGQLAQYKNKESYDKHVNCVIDDDGDDDNDDDYAKAALAIPMAVTQVENKKETQEESTISQEEMKTIKMIGGKDAKEYMKEYQRNYRKKQKNIVLNQ